MVTIAHYLVRRQPRRWTPWLLAGCLMFLGAALTAMAQAVSVTAAFDRLFIEQGESVQYTVSVDNAQNVQPIQLPQIPGLARQPDRLGTGQQTQIINGAMRTTYTATYGLVPAKPGDFVVPAIRVIADGREYRTPEVRCQVTPATEHTNVFWLNLVTERDTYTLGEIIPIEVQIFSAYSIGSASPPSLTLDGFVKGQAEPAQGGHTSINGRQHVVLTYRMTATASRAGDLTLGPVSCEFVAVISRGFFGGDERRITVESKGKLLHIVEPPLNGRPLSYSGAVGRFTAQAIATRTNLVAGDAVTVKIAVKGQGSFDSLPAPTLSEQSGLHVYPGTNSFVAEVSSGIIGTKTFEQAVIVEDPGITQLKFEPISFFDPQTHSYDSIQLPPIPIRVAPATGSPTSNMPVAANDAKAVASDGLRPLKVDIGSAGSISPGPADSPWFVVVAFSPVALYAGTAFVLGLLAKRRSAVKPADTGVASRDVLLNSLAAAADKGDSRAYYNTLNQLLQAEIAPIAGVPPNSVTPEIIDSKLIPMGLPEDAGNRLKKLFEGVDEARFGGVAKPGVLRAALADIEPTLKALSQLQWRN